MTGSKYPQHFSRFFKQQVVVRRMNIEFAELMLNKITCCCKKCILNNADSYALHISIAMKTTLRRNFLREKKTARLGEKPDLSERLKCFTLIKKH
jgi:hypothetical protein